MKQRDHALKIVLKSGLAHDRMTFQCLHNKAVKKFYINLINYAEGNSTQVWENINKVRKKTVIKEIKILNYKFREI